MSYRKTLSRLAIASLTAASFAAPAAASPALDMHASTVQKPKPAKLDLRGEAAADAAVTPSIKKDLRGEAAASPSPAPAPRTLPGPPTWPAYPTPLPLPTEPTVVADDGGGIEVPVPVLAILGTLVLGAGMAMVVVRHRPRTSVAH